MGDISSLGDRLAALRKAAGLSQNDLADRLEVSRSSYQYYERNERDLPASLLLKLCQIFDDDAHRILTGGPSALVLNQIEEIASLVEERLEDLDIDISAQARWRVISKVLKDNFRLRPAVAQSADSDEIDNLLRMIR
ncbi:helix-turn-helix domain-containing protein [Paracoccus denitrificans]|uniref:helix-turn-helix transcriptional regulator n=1 Tax=Paracoccus denitrificans TaxID=266 RepID=UPI001E4F6A27|nr:helix-turn-helix transcriptional regulator [Paracoccus denitrificans]UFS65728.1 helix-turn-helix domain-containing protein [Paracoccus denitrificans]